ncbi:hypothetical protein N657DRAFT_673658 [Parathielavia appendiculata]|uniref:Uncharacterized protein n=1 Tax=Parathielavia appendiculata TaxID=2587402 RepID=A0AAN6Z0Y0_9PEZI|nr:hypothetical protein N657DRAFT_673658 [Parathielavia appendiculata]
MSPPTHHPDQGPHGQSFLVDEAKMREEAAMMAMMDDLGVARVDELPLDEDRGRGRRDRGHGHRGYGGGTNAHKCPPPLPAPQAPRRAPVHGNNPAAGWNFAQAWTDAIESGMFDDDDAQMVKGLDDLGGGRLYDRVVDQTVRILHQRNMRTAHQIEHPVRNNSARADDHGRNNIHDSFLVVQRQAASRARTSNNHSQASSGHGPASRSQGMATPAKSKNKSAKLNPMSRPARRPPLPPLEVPSLVVPLPEAVVNASTREPFEPTNATLKISVKFASRDIKPAQPSVIFLSSAKKPELGFFDVAVYGYYHYCHWAITAWYDYATGTDDLLFVTFQDAGSFQGYELHFANGNDLMEFMSRVRSLKAGDYLDQVESALAPSSAVQPAPPSNLTVAAAPVVDASTRTPATSTTLPAAPASRDVPPSTRTTQYAAISPAPVPAQVAPPVTNGNTTPAIPVENATFEPTIKPEQNALVELGQDEAGATTSQANLDGVEFLSRQELKHIARTIFQVMFRAYPPGMTAEEWDNLAMGIRTGVVEHMVKDAREKGFDEQRVQAIKDTVNEALDAEVKVNRARQGAPNGHLESESRVNGVAQPEPSTRTTKGRIQYSAGELLSLRHAAVNPPDSMANIPHLPRPGGHPRQSDTSPRSPYPAGPAISRIQFQKSAGAMDWVLGKATFPQPLPEQSSSVQQLPVPKSEAGSARPCATRDVGLQNSRWASGTSEIKHANAFTGPTHEKAWSKRSYLEDLAQLDPQTRVTAAAEDLMDLYFPLPNDGLSEPQTSVTQDTQQPAAAVPEPAVAAHEAEAATSTRSDKVENLRVGISRLSIWSPTNMPSGRARAPIQAPSSVVQASRDLWAQAISTASTQPPSLSPPAPSGGSTHVIPPRVSSLQSNSTMVTQSPASPLGSQMASRYAVPLSVSAQSSASTAAQTPRTADHQSSQVSTSEAGTQAPQPPPPAASTQPHSYMVSIGAQSSSVLTPQPGAQAAQPKPRGLAASRHANSGGPSSSGNFKFVIPKSPRK